MCLRVLYGKAHPTHDCIAYSKTKTMMSPIAVGQMYFIIVSTDIMEFQPCGLYIILYSYYKVNRCGMRVSFFKHFGVKKIPLYEVKDDNKSCDLLEKCITLLCQRQALSSVALLHSVCGYCFLFVIIVLKRKVRKR